MLFLYRMPLVFETAATILLQGLTAHYLATDSHKTQKEKQYLSMLQLG
jgi:NADPH:quinone reductase-like Zn-dependent oxidoreductase